MSITNRRIATQEQTGYACPEFHQGTLTDGRRFEFRYRNGLASLAVWRNGSYSSLNREYADMQAGDALQGVFDDDEMRDKVFAELLVKLRVGDTVQLDLLVEAIDRVIDEQNEKHLLTHDMLESMIATEIKTAFQTFRKALLEGKR